MAQEKGLTTMGTQLPLCKVSGPVTDLLQKLSGKQGEKWLKGLNRFLRKEGSDWSKLIIIDLETVDSSGSEAVVRLKRDGHDVDPMALGLLFGSDCQKFGKVGTRYKLMVLKACERDVNSCTLDAMLAEARRRGLVQAPPEVVTALRSVVSNEQLEEWGLFRLAVYHRPLASGVLGGKSRLLCLDRKDGNSCLYATTRPTGDLTFAEDAGLAFVIPAGA